VYLNLLNNQKLLFLFMSHFTYIKTCFQNLFYLEKALNKLSIDYVKKEEDRKGLIISQSNGHNIEFVWNEQEYELLVDISFWDQSYCVESFIDKIAQQYAGEVIIGESQKSGFQPIKFHQNKDGSNTLILERWSEVPKYDKS
jgi:Protein of unknown function (DUF1257)